MAKNYVNNNMATISRPRSRFDLSYSYKTSFNLGDLIPCYIQEILPGDTFKVDTTEVYRTTTPFIRPIMDNLFLDVHYFFVPYRLVLDTWKSVMGENTDGPWAQDSVYSVPQVTGVVKTGSLANYLGIPLSNNLAIQVSRLPFRAYALIYNHYYRDENYQDPVYVSTSDTEVAPLNDDAFGPDNIYGKVAKANKIRDYFTNCLPAPQKGDAVQVPVLGVENMFNYNGVPYRMFGTSYEDSGISDVRFMFDSGEYVENGEDNMYIANLGASVNDIRSAFAMQRQLERLALFGSRYNEMLFGEFGVKAPANILQYPEYLSGTRTPVSVTQVNQTSQSTDASPLAQVSGYSLSNGRQGFAKSFVEHGVVLGLACVRQVHSYQQGLEKFYTRKFKTDFPTPIFANMSEQPVYKSEIFVGTPNNNEQVWGYQPIYEDCRRRVNSITGQLATGSNSGLDVWHLGDYYESAPVMNGEWLKETPEFLDRCLSAPSSTIDNFIFDFYHKVSAVRSLPTYGTPGIIDHR